MFWGAQPWVLRARPEVGDPRGSVRFGAAPAAPNHRKGGPERWPRSRKKVPGWRMPSGNPAAMVAPRKIQICVEFFMASSDTLAPVGV